MKKPEMIESGVCNINEMLDYYEAIGDNSSEVERVAACAVASLAHLLKKAEGRRTAIAIACCVINQTIRTEGWQMSSTTGDKFNSNYLSDLAMRSIVSDALGIPEPPDKS